MKYIDQTFDGIRLIPQEKEPYERMLRWLQLTSFGQRTDEKGQAGVWFLGTAVQVLFTPAVMATYRHLTWRGVVSALWKHPNPGPHEFHRLKMYLYSPFYSIPKLPEPAVARAAFAGTSEALTEIETALSDGRQYIEGAFSLADIFIANQLNCLELVGVLDSVLMDRRNTREYWSRVKRRESFFPSFRPPAESPGQKEMEKILAAFRKDIEERGVVAVYNLDGGDEEEEEE